jgi:hypothetical protein
LNPFAMDMNGDGGFTLGDVWLWLLQGFFLPGDCLLWICLTFAPGLARFLELGPTDYGGLASGSVSAVFWLVAAIFLGASYNVLRSADRAVSAAIARTWRECLRGMRVARIRLACRFRGIKLGLPLPERRAPPAIALEELELSELEAEVLRSHAFLAAGYVYTASDIASSLGIRRSQAQQALDRLMALQLLESALSGSDGESGYRLSRAGQFLLMARSGAAGA